MKFKGSESSPQAIPSPESPSPSSDQGQDNYVSGLEYRETLYRRVIESTHEGFILGDRQCMITDVNDAFCRMTGFTPAEIVGKYMWEIYDDHTQVCLVNKRNQMILSRDRRFEGSLKRKDGSTIPVKVHGNILTDDQDNLLGNGAFIVDLTQQKQQEDLLRRSLNERDQALNQLRDELAEATKYVKSVLPPPLQSPTIQTQWIFLPAATLGGDAFGYQWLDDDHFAVYLIDVSGHGVGPALLSVSAINMLRSKSLPDTDFTQPGQVLESLNQAFPGERHNFMFFTMWYGVYNLPNRTLTYSSGGHPPALFVEKFDPGSPATHKLGSRNVVLGAITDATYTQESIRIDNPGCLYVFSDGAFEVTQPDGSFWGLDNFLNYIREEACKRPSVLESLESHVKTLTGTDSLADDLTAMEVHFS